MSVGVPRKSKIDSNTCPSVVGNPSISILASLGLTGKQCVPLNNYNEQLELVSSYITIYLNNSAIMTPHDQISKLLK